MKSIAEILKSKGITEATRFHNYEYLYEMMKTCCDEYGRQFCKPDVNGALLVEIKSLLEQYRDEEMPDWNAPFHYDAEGWAAMKYFIQWLERKSNDH